MACSTRWARGKAVRNSSASAQCVVTRRPSSTPAWPSTKDPAHSDTNRAPSSAAVEMASSTAGFCGAQGASSPGTTTVSAPLIHSTGLRSAIVNPRDVGVGAWPQTPTSYGASGSSRILENTEGRRPKACTATARSRTNVPPNTIMATRWRRTPHLLARSVGSMALSVVRGPSRAQHNRRMEPDTIVLVHGFWVTPRSWEHWITYYEAKGYQVLAPGYPGFEVEVEALREDPQIIVDVTVPAIIE